MTDNEQIQEEWKFFFQLCKELINIYQPGKPVNALIFIPGTQPLLYSMLEILGIGMK